MLSENRAAIRGIVARSKRYRGQHRCRRAGLIEHNDRLWRCVATVRPRRSKNDAAISAS
jgi:hypothetical protein